MKSHEIIRNINTLFEPLGLKVDNVIDTAQSTKYILNLPLDYTIQGKIKRAESNLKYSLSTAIGSKEYTYGHDATSVYVEVKRDTLTIVDFNDIKDVTKSPNLNLVLGVDQAGNKMYTNLSKAPHILVGGTTGSGKSELLHCFVASLIEGMPYTHAALYIIDPKRAEYSPYKNCKSITLITEMNEATEYLKRAVDLMETRYAELERNRAKDIYKYHGSMDMCPIVFIIDELADLMMTCPSVETYIARIAQKARACGIHLIIGTQSPRVDIIKGIIKANMPTRIALKTKSAIESRVVLDRAGAEYLYGTGDMLFLPNGKFEPIRMQSAYVSEEYKVKLAESIRIRQEPSTVNVTNNVSAKENFFSKTIYLDLLSILHKKKGDT